MTQCIPRTSVFLGTDQFLNSPQMIDQSGRIHQPEIRTEDLVQALTLNKYLGKGSFGAAYTCMFINPQDGTASSCVIKLPVDLIDEAFQAKYTALENHGLNEITEAIDHLEKSATGSWIRVNRTSGARNLREECRHAEAILEPPIYHLRKVLARRGGANAHLIMDAGKRFENLSRQEYTFLADGMRRVRSHPGHAHWHPILHVDFSIPCIISEAAEGNLQELMDKLRLHRIREACFTHDMQTMIPKVWLAIAYQVGMAIQYMHSFSTKIHTDLKPENILYTFKNYAGGGGDGKILHLWVADYGLCMNNEPIHITLNNFRGTPAFTPNSSDHAGWSAHGGSRVGPPGVAVTIYQYIMSLLTCILLLQDDTNITPLFQYNLPLPREDIFDGRTNIYQKLNSVNFQEQRYKTVWRNFLKLLYFPKPTEKVRNFNVFLTNIMSLGEQAFQFMMPLVDYHRVIKNITAPQSFPEPEHEDGSSLVRFLDGLSERRGSAPQWGGGEEDDFFYKDLIQEDKQRHFLDHAEEDLMALLGRS